MTIWQAIESAAALATPHKGMLDPKAFRQHLLLNGYAIRKKQKRRKPTYPTRD